MKPLISLFLCLSLVACSTTDDLKFSTGGTSFIVREKSYDDIWKAANSALIDNFKIVETNKETGTLKAEHSMSVLSWGEVVGVFIQPSRTGATEYLVEVQSLKRASAQVFGTDWANSIIENIKAELNKTTGLAIYEDNPEKKAFDEVFDSQNHAKYFNVPEKVFEFKKNYPKSNKLPELELFVADYEYKNGFWKSSHRSYKQLLIDYPNHTQKTYIEKQIIISEEDIIKFHRHISLSVILGRQIFTTDDLENKTNGKNLSFRFDVSYYYNENQGTFISGDIQSLNGKNEYFSTTKPVVFRMFTAGTKFRKNLNPMWSLFYGVGAGVQYNELDNAPTRHNLGLQQFVETNYCWRPYESNACWQGTFPTIGIYHTYVPSGRAGNQDFSGNLIMLGIGVRFR